MKASQRSNTVQLVWGEPVRDRLERSERNSLRKGGAFRSLDDARTATPRGVRPGPARPQSMLRRTRAGRAASGRQAKASPATSVASTPPAMIASAEGRSRL